jgi:hypothetical protein
VASSQGFRQPRLPLHPAHRGRRPPAFRRDKQRVSLRIVAPSPTPRGASRGATGAPTCRFDTSLHDLRLLSHTHATYLAHLPSVRRKLWAPPFPGVNTAFKNSGEKKKLALARVCESGARCFCVANSKEQVRKIFIISSIFTLEILDWPSYDFSRKKQYIFHCGSLGH